MKLATRALLALLHHLGKGMRKRTASTIEDVSSPDCPTTYPDSMPVKRSMTHKGEDVHAPETVPVPDGIPDTDLDTPPTERMEEDQMPLPALGPHPAPAALLRLVAPRERTEKSF